MTTRTTSAPAVSIERVADQARWPVVDSLLREYLPWALERFRTRHDVHFDDADAEMDRHHASFAADMPRLLAAPGRLLIAHLHGKPAGMIALKPVHACAPQAHRGVGEIKRMFVRTAARGQGIGRTLMHRLLADARAEGFQTLRLETLSFMTEARALYRSVGFVDVPAFVELPADRPDIARVLRFMALTLQPQGHTPAVAQALA